MNKKEVLEIRRQFSPENCAITRICGCYVDHEKEKKMEMKKAFLSLPEEEDLFIAATDQVYRSSPTAAATPHLPIFYSSPANCAM